MTTCWFVGGPRQRGRCVPGARRFTMCTKSVQSGRQPRRTVANDSTPSNVVAVTSSACLDGMRHAASPRRKVIRVAVSRRLRTPRAASSLPQEFSHPALQKLLKQGRTNGSGRWCLAAGGSRGAEVAKRMKTVLRSLDEQGITVTLDSATALGRSRPLRLARPPRRRPRRPPRSQPRRPPPRRPRRRVPKPRPRRPRQPPRRQRPRRQPRRRPPEQASRLRRRPRRPRLLPTRPPPRRPGPRRRPPPKPEPPRPPPPRRQDRPTRLTPRTTMRTST